MKKIKKHLNFLRALSSASPKHKKLLLKNATNPEVLAICEVCLNLLAGNFPVNVKKLQKFKTSIRKVACRSTQLKNKKRILVNQSGGFLPIILPAVISAIAGMAGRAIGNRI